MAPWHGLIVVSALAAMLAGPVALAQTVLVPDRPEFRSYQPYTGLQDENVPLAPPV